MTLTSCFVVQADDANHSTFCSSKSISKHVSLRDQQVWKGQNIIFHLSPLCKDIWKGMLTVRWCDKVHHGAEMGVTVKAMVSTFRADHAKEMSTQGHPFCVEQLCHMRQWLPHQAVNVVWTSCPLDVRSPWSLLGWKYRNCLHQCLLRSTIYWSIACLYEHDLVLLLLVIPHSHVCKSHFALKQASC